MTNLKSRALNSARAVAVLGASGHTGRFVVNELLKRGITPVALGRSPESLERAGYPARGIDCRIVDIADVEALTDALSDTDALINCAGPFLDTAEAAVAAAIAAGIHYLDVTAEQPSVQATLDKFDAPARAAGAAVLPGMGFYGGFADLLAAVAIADWDKADAIDVMIGLDSWHPTEGTRITGARNTARRLVIKDGNLVPVEAPALTKDWDFPAPIGPQVTLEVPFSEVILMARSSRVGTLHTYLSANALGDIRDASTPAPVLDETNRSSQQFVVELVVKRDGQTRRIVAKGRDIYAFTAPLVCEAAERLLAPGFDKAGTFAPSEIFDARAMLEALQPEHLTFDIIAD